MAEETLCIELTPKTFLHLRALCNAFEVADEDDAVSAVITVKGLGSISWEQNMHVLINLEKEWRPGDAKEE